MTGQAVLPGGEVPGEERRLGSDDEGHAGAGLRRPLAHAAGGAAAR